MVEGHSVHRVASRFRLKFVGRKFAATSPNGRFTSGAKAINRKEFSKIEAVGKNLFAFFGKNRVVHIHFGMSGRWAIFRRSEAPEPSKTTRLVLSNRRLGLEAHLSAMTVEFGDAEMYETKRGKLGEDPLDDNANVTKLRKRVQSSNKSISKLLMDQGFFAGVGNIYRAEILYCAKMHPEIKGCDLSDDDFNRVWNTAVRLMQIGYKTGRITSLNTTEAKLLGDENRRRYVYNQEHCFVCGARVSSWQENSRTVWACLTCQSKPGSNKCETTQNPRKRKSNDHTSASLFFSKCASEPFITRRKYPQKLLVSELKRELKRLGYSSSGKKMDLVARLQRHIDDLQEHTADFDATRPGGDAHGYNKRLRKKKKKNTSKSLTPKNIS